MKTKNIWVGRIVAIAAFYIAILFAPIAARAMIMLPVNSAPALAFSADDGYDYQSGVYPNPAFLSPPATFKVVYNDPDNDRPEYVRLIIDGASYGMMKDDNQDGQYYNGEQYFASAPAGILTAGKHSYHFETSDGDYTARLPASGEFEFELKNNPVIIIPGILGSEQKDGVWVIDPILHTYDNLIDTFKANGFIDGVDLFTFPYEWRQSNVESALQLKEKIDQVKQICHCDKVNLVAHSMGGLVARQYIQSDAYAHDVSQLIFLGTPHLGAPYAYLTWEAGENGRGVVDRIINFLFTREAEKADYASSFDYVIHKPITSLEELLPIYDYIKDKTNDQLRTYPNNYPENHFLEDLDNNLDKLYGSGVKVSNIVGDLGPNSTLNIIRVVDSPWKPLWEDGFPDGYDGTTADLGLEAGDGDGTVPIDSSEDIDCDTTVLNSEHRILPTDAEKLIVTKLSATKNPIAINNSYIPNIKLLIIKILSPADIVVIAPDGQRVGKDFSTGREINEIDGAFYSGFQTDDEYITIPDPLDGLYKVEAQGTGNGGEYTVAVGYVSDNGLSDSDYKSSILPGMITELNVNINSSSPDDLQVKPADDVMPKITIASPLAQDYTRENPLIISITNTSVGSGWSQNLRVDGKIIQNNSVIDLFAEKLGGHIFTATMSDLSGHIVTATVPFRLIVTPTSVIQDIEKMYDLGWIKNKDAKNDLINNMKLIIRMNKVMETIKQKIPLPKNTTNKFEIIEERIDKILGQQFIKLLEKKHSKALNDRAYNLLIEDINWLLNN